jgi:hypothetical protein
MTKRNALIMAQASPALRQFMATGELPQTLRERNAVMDEMRLHCDLPIVAMAATDEMLDATKRKLDEVFDRIRKNEKAVTAKKSGKPVVRPVGRPVIKTFKQTVLEKAKSKFFPSNVKI